MRMTSSRSASIKVQFFSTKRQLNYKTGDGAGLYIFCAITCECRLISRLSKRLDLEKETAKQQVVIGKDSRQKRKRSLRKRHLQGEDQTSKKSKKAVKTLMMQSVPYF